MDKEFIIAFNQRYRLGKRAFFLFLAQRIKFPLAILALTLVFWYFDYLIPPTYAVFNALIVQYGFALAGAVLLIIIFRTYFEYKGYSYKFNREYFEITRGYMVKNEIAIAYHQIQHVNVQRNILDQTLGICHLILVLVGNNNMKDSAIILPAVSKRRARVVQQELMRQARRHFYQPQEETAIRHEA